jgi:CRISP-associated protein Cas1
MWATRIARNGAPRAKRRRSWEPLVLSGHGASLRIEGGALTIRNGLTHYPQKQEAYRFFKGELAIPERIILLDGSGSISLGLELNKSLDV